MSLGEIVIIYVKGVLGSLPLVQKSTRTNFRKWKRVKFYQKLYR